MIIHKTLLAPAIFLLRFENQRELASTFLRFQEFYESPKFKGKIFTLEEYKQWYRTLPGKRFTYYTDWSGFNVPSVIFQPFYECKFDPLSEKEKQLLALFKDQKESFYVIAIAGDTEKSNSIRDHELAHALFHVNPVYRKKSLAILKKYDLQLIKQHLLSMDGYHEDVLDDEVQAYTLFPSETVKNLVPKGLRWELHALFLEAQRTLK